MWFVGGAVAVGSHDSYRTWIVGGCVCMRVIPSVCPPVVLFVRFKLVAGGVRRVDHVGGRPVSLSLGFSIRYVCDC